LSSATVIFLLADHAGVTAINKTAINPNLFISLTPL
jgi:hypothetical protein